MRFKSLLMGLVALSVCSGALAQQTVVGGPGAPPASGGTVSPGGSSGQIQYNNGGVFGGLSTLTNSSGVITNSASTTGASFQLTGTYTASTTSPFLYIDPAATASTTFSANGTMLGINAVSGYTGDFINIQKNNVSVLSVGSVGNVLSQSNISFGSSSALQRNGAVLIASKAVVSGTGIGTSPPTSVGLSSAAFTQAAGTGPTNSTFILTFPTAATNGYICSGQDLTAPGTVIAQTAVTSTTVSTMQAYTRAGVTTSLTAADVIAFQCMPY